MSFFKLESSRRSREAQMLCIVMGFFGVLMMSTGGVLVYIVDRYLPERVMIFALLGAVLALTMTRLFFWFGARARLASLLERMHLPLN